MSEAAADPKIEPAPARRLPLVWLAPLAAVVVALFLLWREYEARGPLIEVVFPSADGVTAGETALRYRSVDVGRVESLSFTDDLSRVVAKIRVSPDVAPFIDADARFWVVRPEVSARGISGLETVISGAYIEGAWDSDPAAAERRFEALDAPPRVASSDTGQRWRPSEAPDVSQIAGGEADV